MSKSVPELTQFILTHYSPARDWDAAKMFNWLMWVKGNAYVIEVLDDDNSLAGLLIAWPCMNAEDAEETPDDEGPCIFVRTAIALQPGVMQAFAFAILRRFGMRSTVAWKTDFGVTKEYSAKALRRNLIRATFQTAGGK